MGIGRVTIPAGQTSGTIRLNTIAGSIVTRETVTVTLKQILNGSAAIGTPDSAQAGIVEGFPVTPIHDFNYAVDKAFLNGEVFTRGSQATVIDENGIVQIVAADVPRFGHNPNTLESLGFLSETAKTNFIPNSEELSNWDAGLRNNINLTSNDEVSPNDTLTADTITENTNTGTHFWGERLAAGIAANQIATASVYFKRTSGTRNIKIGFSDGLGSGCRAVFDGGTGAFIVEQSFGTGSVIRTYGPFLYPNGWIRVGVTGICSTGNAADQARVYMMDGTAENYTGDGSSALAIWGFQVEHNSASTVASSLSSYIPTFGSSAVRAADGNGQGAIIDPFTFPSTYSFLVELTPTPMADVEQGQLSTIIGATLSSSDETHRFDNRRDDNAAGARINFTSASGSGSDWFEVVNSPEAPMKIASRHALNNKNYAVDGVSGTADTSTAQPNVNRLGIGAYPFFNVRNAEAHIGRVVIWDVGLTDPQLEDVTSP